MGPDRTGPPVAPVPATGVAEPDEVDDRPPIELLVAAQPLMLSVPGADELVFGGIHAPLQFGIAARQRWNRYAGPSFQIGRRHQIDPVGGGH